jgi:NAD(P)H-dependent FMN reductase
MEKKGPRMITIAGISGSLRKHSCNAGLLRAAAKSAPDGCSVSVGSIRGIPLYDGDVEVSQGIPPAVTELKQVIRAADGLLLVTPEYNNGIPGVFKNAIDWLTRPPEERMGVFAGKPVGLIGATPGNFGTAFSQYAWLPVLRVLNTQVWSGRLLWVSGAMGKFDERGNLTDDKVKTRLKKYMTGFTEFVGRLKG